MAEQVTFIHAADLHLGASFRGVRALSNFWADRLTRAIPEAWTRVVDAAIRSDVDFMVLAGDIFDTARSSYADYLCFFEGLKRLDEAGIAVYLCTGNHDPYTSWEHDFFALPENTVMLPAEQPGFFLYERKGKPLCLIGGRGYYNQTWPQDQNIAEGITRAAAEAALGPRAARAPFGVGVLHTGLNLDLTKAPVNPKELQSTGFDFWALGHIHARCALPEDNPRIAFSGCIQGRDMKETGQRGVNLVTLTQGEPNCITFIPTASVVWQRLDVDVSACSHVADIYDAAIRELFHANGKAQCEEMCVRITLVGQTPLHRTLGKTQVIEDMRKAINDAYPVFFCDALIDKTTEPIDKQMLQSEGLFPAVLLQMSGHQRTHVDEQISSIEDIFLKKNLAIPSISTECFEQLSEEAERLVLDLLTKDDQL